MYEMKIVAHCTFSFHYSIEGFASALFGLAPPAAGLWLYMYWERMARRPHALSTCLTIWAAVITIYHARKREHGLGFSGCVLPLLWIITIYHARKREYGQTVRLTLTQPGCMLMKSKIPLSRP